MGVVARWHTGRGKGIGLQHHFVLSGREEQEEEEGVGRRRSRPIHSIPGGSWTSGDESQLGIRYLTLKLGGIGMEWNGAAGQ